MVDGSFVMLTAYLDDYGNLDSAETKMVREIVEQAVGSFS